MATAASLHAEGESLEEIHDLLADSPIEQSLWDTLSQVYVEQANYALHSECMELTSKGLSFLGSHSAGGEYGAFRFAAHGKKYGEVSEADGRMVVPLTDAGDIETAGLLDAREYLELAGLARRSIGMEEEPGDDFYQLVRVFGDVEPVLLRPRVPAENYALRDAVIRHLKAAPNLDEDGLYYLHCQAGRPLSIHPFTGGEMEEMRKEAEG